MARSSYIYQVYNKKLDRSLAFCTVKYEAINLIRAYLGHNTQFVKDDIDLIGFRDGQYVEKWNRIKYDV